MRRNRRMTTTHKTDEKKRNENKIKTTKKERDEDE